MRVSLTRPLSRRGAIARCGQLAAALGLFPASLQSLSESSVADDRQTTGFSERGYYLTFMRMPVMGLTEWRGALECFAEDRTNLLILWVAGAFRSKKYPITWQYNREHENVRNDFGRELIDYAHSKGIRVLLGFTPFGYDGVNQLPVEQPLLKARQKDGRPVDAFGIHCWGWNLCPAQPVAQRFMREYVREMFADFYPDADGLFIESSDYAICHCPDCGPRYYEREFEFVRAVSDEFWAARRDGMIVVYPHYFTGKTVPGFGVPAARLPFNSRWTLFFTPHSAHFDADLIARAKHTIFWGDSPILGTPHKVQEHARMARRNGMTGFVPSLEAYSFVPTHAEGGEPFVTGKRMRPFGLDVLAEGKMPYDSLLARLQRLAVRAFTDNPELSLARFREKVGVEIFGVDYSSGTVEDLLTLQEIWVNGSDWCWSSPLLDPEFYAQRAARLQWSKEKRFQDGARLETVRAIATRTAKATNPAEREMHRLSQMVVNRWGRHHPDDIIAQEP